MSKKVLLYSGGTDSWLIRQLWNPDICLYLDMGGMYSHEEYGRIENTFIPHKGETLIHCDLPLGQFEDKETAFIPMRNMYLLMHACYYGDEICLGATKEDAGGSSDKDLDFLNEAEHLLNRLWKKQSLYDGKKIKIEKRFMNCSKEDLLKEYLNNGGDIQTFKDETFSCYRPESGNECMSCKACFRKFIVCYAHGARYTKNELTAMRCFIEDEVIHRIHHAQGRYFLDKENGKETLEVIKKLYEELGEELHLE